MVKTRLTRSDVSKITYYNSINIECYLSIMEYFGRSFPCGVDYFSLRVCSRFPETFCNFPSQAQQALG